MYLKHGLHKNYTWRKCSRVLTNCLVVQKCPPSATCTCPVHQKDLFSEVSLLSFQSSYITDESWCLKGGKLLWVRNQPTAKNPTHQKTMSGNFVWPRQKLRSQWTIVYRYIWVLRTKYPAVYVLKYFCTWILYQ